MTIVMAGGGEARTLADAGGWTWRSLDDDLSEATTVVVFGTFEDLLTVLRTCPRHTVWRPSGQRLPLPRSAPWSLRRLDLAVAPEEVLGRAIAASGAPTTIIPSAVDTSGPSKLASGLPPSMELRLVVVLDSLDHTAGTAMTVLRAVTQGLVMRCGGCGGFAPFRFSPVTAGRADPEPCPCGGDLENLAPLNARAYLTVRDATQVPWAHGYLADLRSLLGLEGRVVLDGDPSVDPPKTEPELMSRIATCDVHLSASSGLSLPRGVLLAAAVGVPSITPGHGAAAGVAWVHPCGYRTETLADDSVRVLLDPADTARAILELAGDAEACRRLAEAARRAMTTHDVARLTPRWVQVLAQVGGRPTPGWRLDRIGPPSGRSAGLR